MIQVLGTSWALLLGITLLMIGNGMQGTLLGVRGGLEGFTTTEMSVVMTGYFAGFLLGSQMVPDLIRRVGHVRVFAALGSLASAGLILYPVLTTPWAWTALRLLLGFCFCGVYIVAESWLNNTTTNETRGRALALYLIAQSAGIVIAQAIFALGDAGDFVLFAVVSVLVSLAFAPMLLSAVPVPAFETAKPMSFRAIYRTSPLGFVGIFILGSVFSSVFGMAGVFGALAGLTAAEIALFVAVLYGGALVMQYPLGWASDRIDRRRLIVAACAVGMGGCVLGATGAFGIAGLMAAAFLVGGVANPLYGMLLAYTNDFLDPSDMASASARLLFVNGLGAIGGPIVCGWLMEAVGPAGFFAQIGVLMGMLAAYGLWRMRRRTTRVPTGEQTRFVPIGSSATPVTFSTATDIRVDDAAAPPSDRAA